MSEFWLISAPGDQENLQALERMNTVTSKSNLSYNTKFSIPDFKVGTLDSLVGLSDELGKLDTFAESLIKKMAQSVVEVMEDAKGKVPENLLANGVDLPSFVTHFEWDMAKYPTKQPLVSVVDTLAKQLAQIETDLKSRTATYNTLKTNLENLEKKSMGNLFTRTLSNIVSKEDFVLGSEYLITLLVIVPKPSYTKWQKTYESLSDMVVPRSTKLIAEDNEGGLFTVTLFRKVIEDFKTKARENKFTVREFYYDEKEIKREREEMSRLLSDKKQQYVSKLHRRAGFMQEHPPPLGAMWPGNLCSPGAARVGLGKGEGHPGAPSLGELPSPGSAPPGGDSKPHCAAEKLRLWEVREHFPQDEETGAGQVGIQAGVPVLSVGSPVPSVTLLASAVWFPRRDGIASVVSTCIYSPYAFSKEWGLILEVSGNSHSETFRVHGQLSSRGSKPGFESGHVNGVAWGEPLCSAGWAPSCYGEA
ncbi:V-type proton ATPase subunit C 2 isoform X1 [Mirounga leonina]|uniref:V-type proton ATPase subunit C 2 isoform X1 n=2 Tax=Mirounga leonina TaxID=9715 RepID=UPI00156BF3E2|nr:V-type proton ATPase subunit C 2 isoform X1 [Mirounga leonina]XP_034856474.1 V-type proton ATPase subunit C 2 isoform X1 [Mirounga leonina]